MKYLFIVAILFLNTNGKLEITRSVDKCYSYNAYAMQRWFMEPKHFNDSILPIDSYVLPYLLNEQKWMSYCYSQSFPDIIFYENTLIYLPKPSCPEEY